MNGYTVVCKLRDILSYEILKPGHNEKYRACLRRCLDALNELCSFW